MSFDDRETQFVEDTSEVELSGQTNLTEDIRTKVTHSELLGCGVIGSVRGVHYGTWKDKPSCLVLLQFTFRSKAGALRLKSADLHVSFQKQSSAGTPSVTEGPRLENFSPRKIYGTPVTEHRKWTYEFSAQANIGAGLVSAGPTASIERESAFLVEHRLKIVGQPWSDRRREEPHQVLWSVQEASKTGYGIPDTLNTGIVISYNGPFQATVEVSAKLGVGIPIYTPPWSKDDPLLFNGTTEKGSPPSNREFDQLTESDWARLVPYSSEWEVSVACSFLSPSSH